MNYEGLTPFPIRRFGGSADYDDPTLIPPGLATVARNVRFRKTSVRTRDGLKHTMTYDLGAGKSGDVTGFDVLEVLDDNPTQVSAVMTDQGVMLQESPAGSGTLVPLVTPFILPNGASMQTAKAYNQLFMAISDLKTALLPPMSLDGRSGVVSPVSQNPVAGLWRSDLLYDVGDLVRSPDGRWWRCFVPTTSRINTQAPQYPAVNGQFIGSALSAPASAVTLGSDVPITLVGGPWYVYVQNGSSGTPFMGPFPVQHRSVLVGGHLLEDVTDTFQVQIPADAGLSNWNIYIGTSPSLAAMTQRWVVVGTVAAQTFIANTQPTVVAAPGAVGTWSPATTTDSNSAQWEEWTPICTNQLPAPDISNSATTISDNPGAGTIPNGKDVYVKVAFRIGVGESPRSSSLVFVNTASNDQVIVSFGNSGGIRIPRWIAEIDLQPNFFQAVTLDVYVAVVATGANVPADSAYNLYLTGQSLGSSLVIASAGSAPSTIGPTANSGAYASPTLAYDGDLTTRSIGTAGGGGHPLNVTEVWSAFPAGTASSNVLRIKSVASVPNTIQGNGEVLEEYSLDSGATWHAVYDITANRAVTIDSIPLPNGQDFTHIQVRATASSLFNPHYTAPTVTHSVYEIWIDSQTAPLGSSAGAAYITSAYPNAPAAYIGETGNRYMAVLRANTEASLSPIDPDSPIAAGFVGKSVANIISINRDTSGNVQATVDDVSRLAPGQSINVQGCLAVATLNGPAFISSVQTTLDPQGIVKWSGAITGAPASDFTGTLTLPAQPAPFAFLPPGGPTTEEYVAAFTVVGAQKAGPFFYISEADPDVSLTVQVLSILGTTQVQQSLSAGVNRFDGGYTQAVLGDITGIAPGQTILIQGTAGFPGMEGQFTIQAVEPVAGGKTGKVYWTSPNTSTAGPCSVGTATIFIGTAGAVQAIVADASQLQAGLDVYLQNPTNPQFNGLATIASVKGNVVTLSLSAGGSATGGTLTVLQVLPTIAPGQAAQITAISRDASGNVIAQVSDVGGFTAGELIFAAGVTDATFNGLFSVTNTVTDANGISGSILWQQANQAAALSTGGSITGCPDPMINFDDNSLSSSVDNDVTAQLTAMPAPDSVDIYYSPSLNMMVYTTGKDSNHYFSDAGDPGNVQNPTGILGVEQANGKKTICFREMINGELISCKEDGGYAITPGPVNQQDYGVSKRWGAIRPAGPRAAAVTKDFMIVFDEYSGCYRYFDGVLREVGLEKQGTWDRINKDAKEQIWVEIDETRNEVHIGLPLDGATKCNFEVILNYFNGWNEPLEQTMSGDEIPDPHGRRWSENDRKANLMKIVDRDLATPIDQRINHRQLLYAIQTDGTEDLYIDMEVPEQFNDNGNGIDSEYQPAYFSHPQLAIMKWQAMKGRVDGNGLLEMTPTTEAADSDYKTVEQDLTRYKFAQSFGPVENELFVLNFSNGAIPDAWFELQEIVIYGNVSTSGRKA